MAMVIRCFVFVCAFLTPLISAAESYIIMRNNQASFRDRFGVPNTLRPSGDFWNNGTFCRQQYGASRYRDSESDCWCPLENATFGYLNSVWRCYENDALRTHQGCSVQLQYSNQTHRDDALWIINAYKGKAKRYSLLNVTTTNASACEIDAASSKYRTCADEWRPMFQSGNLTRFKLANSAEGYKLEVQKGTTENEHLNGSVIKLVLRCGGRKEECVLFKLKGTIKCPFNPPVPSQTTVNHATPTPCYPTSSKQTTSVRSTRAPITPTKARSSPVHSSSTRVPDVPRDKNKSETGNTDDKLIAFVTTGVIVGVLLVIGSVLGVTLFKRWKNNPRGCRGASTQRLIRRPGLRSRRVSCV